AESSQGAGGGDEADVGGAADPADEQSVGPGGPEPKGAAGGEGTGEASPYPCGPGSWPGYPRPGALWLSPLP
ncbi:MAG: hypothetical protein L0G69_03555, partial [Brevibacterium sp.]|nr:hypothetical protein [Brevibacterium sp.]